MDIRRISSAEDINKFIVTWELVFQRQLSSQIYAWIFSERNNIYACFDGEQLVSGYCLLTIKTIVNQKSVLTGLCNNVFINGFKYQKQGVFTKITNFALDDIAQRGYSFALGFPNKKAIKAHLRAGWSQGDDLPFYEHHREHLLLVNSSVKVTRVDTDIESFTKIKELISSMSAKYSFTVERDLDFVNWRFNLNPRWKYDLFFVYDPLEKLIGFFVTKYFSERKRVHLVDYAFSKSDDLTVSLDTIYEFYESQGLNVDCVDGWCATGDQTLFQKSGFKKSNEFSYVIFKNLSEGSLELGNIAHLTLADNDVY